MFQMRTIDKILEKLIEAGDFLSGQSLADYYGFSRNNVWKAVDSLRSDGYVIDSKKNCGYKYISAPTKLGDTVVRQIARKAGFSRSVYHVSTGSTNTDAKILANTDRSRRPAVIVAEQQLEGRGRLGRQWASPMGGGVYFSMLLFPNGNLNSIQKITTLVGASLLRALRESFDLDIKIKWPNDILYNGKKIAGILTEMTTEENRIKYLVVGIGINFNTEKLPKDLQVKAEGLEGLIDQKFGAVKYTAPQYLEPVLTQITADLKDAGLLSDQEFMPDKIFSRALGYIKEHSATIGRRIMVTPIIGKEGFWAEAIGINQDGELLVKPEGSDDVITVNSGEVSTQDNYATNI